MASDNRAFTVSVPNPGMPGVTGKDMGRVMGAVMKETAGQADGGVVRELVSAKLQ
jgi:uncharacterized protein YqeY